MFTLWKSFPGGDTLTPITICGRGDPLTPITMCGCLYTVEGKESASLFPAQCIHGVCRLKLHVRVAAAMPMASLNLEFVFLGSPHA